MASRRGGVLRVVGAVLAWLLVLSLPVAAPAAETVPSASAVAATPLRVMVVGDSVSQGSAGDWTWRYRVWQRFNDAGVAVDFVGPRDDLFDNVSQQLGDHSYVDPGFDRDHASKWGLSLAFFQVDPPVGLGWTVEDLVATYHPDVVLTLIGVNDLTFLGEQPAEAAALLHQLVDKARSVDPGVDVVLGEVPMPWITKVPAYNALVDDLAGQLDTPTSRVVAADTGAGYVQAEDTWDGNHPDSTGELKIAAAFEDALSSIGDGPSAVRPIAMVPRGPRIPPVLTAHAGGTRIWLNWATSPGATRYELWLRDLTAGGDWQRVAQGLRRPRGVIVAPPAGHHIQLQLAPVKGNWRAEPDAWSNVVELSVPTGRGSRGPGSGRPAGTSRPGRR